MVDDYGGLQGLVHYGTPRPLHWVGLLGARRKFFDLHQANASTMALAALTRIGQLYHTEQQGKVLSIEARQQLRVEQSQPCLENVSLNVKRVYIWAHVNQEKAKKQRLLKPPFLSVPAAE
jgi:transposase